MIHIEESSMSEKSKINFDSKYYQKVYSFSIKKREMKKLRERIRKLPLPECKSREDKRCRAIRGIGTEKKRVAIDLINRVFLKMNTEQSVLYYNVKDSYITSIILDNPKKDIIYTSAGFHYFLNILKQDAKKGDRALWDCLMQHKIRN